MLAAVTASAQTNDLRGIIYNHEMSGGIEVHTAGWGMFFNVAHREELKKKTLWQFEVMQIHHPKEVKQTIDFGLAFFGFNSPKPFKYGKQNNFYLVNAVYGKQFIPYYLNVLYPSDNSNSYVIKAIRYTPETADKFLDWFSIYGGAGFTYGLGEIQFIPGIQLKSGLNFDWAQNEDAIKALEVGIIFDAYYKEVPIMILEKNQQFIPNLYLSIEFGKKW